jgi:hypothetical protein
MFFYKELLSCRPMRYFMLTMGITEQFLLFTFHKINTCLRFIYYRSLKDVIRERVKFLLKPFCPFIASILNHYVHRLQLASNLIVDSLSREGKIIFNRDYFLNPERRILSTANSQQHVMYTLAVLY